MGCFSVVKISSTKRVYSLLMSAKEKWESAEGSSVRINAKSDATVKGISRTLTNTIVLKVNKLKGVELNPLVI